MKVDDESMQKDEIKNWISYKMNHNNMNVKDENLTKDHKLEITSTIFW